MGFSEKSDTGGQKFSPVPDWVFGRFGKMYCTQIFIKITNKFSPTVSRWRTARRGTSLPLQRESGALPRGTSGGRQTRFSLRLGHGERRRGLAVAPSTPLFTGSIVSFAKTSGCIGLKKAIPPLKFAIPPPGTPGSPESVSRVFRRQRRATSPKIPVVFGKRPSFPPRDASPKSRKNHSSRGSSGV